MSEPAAAGIDPRVDALLLNSDLEFRRMPLPTVWELRMVGETHMGQLTEMLLTPVYSR